MPALPTSAFPLLRALLSWALNHILSAREHSTQFALQEPAYFCGTRRASHMTSLACLEIAPSKDFSAFLSLHLFQILQIPHCSHAHSFNRWSSKRKNMLRCSVPLLHPSLTYPWSLFHILLSSKLTCIQIFFFWYGDPLNHNFLFFFCLKYSIPRQTLQATQLYTFRRMLRLSLK